MITFGFKIDTIPGECIKSRQQYLSSQTSAGLVDIVKNSEGCFAARMVPFSMLYVPAGYIVIEAYAVDTELLRWGSCNAGDEKLVLKNLTSMLQSYPQLSGTDYGKLQVYLDRRVGRET